MSAVERFDVERVAKIFQDCLHENDDVLLDSYLEAYEEINKFFHLMGSVFGFVSSDVRSKIDILCEYRRKESTGERFLTIKTMITYEKGEELLKDHSYVSGSRTLLRLHRGLGELVLQIIASRTRKQIVNAGVIELIYIHMYVLLSYGYTKTKCYL
uniref:Glycolipid transfer protein domain-containing protein 1 n=1 Tax=Bactrocera latifrons TaxID=174628 RepID=A0A0K8VBQ5_BACLA